MARVARSFLKAGQTSSEEAHKMMQHQKEDAKDGSQSTLETVESSFRSLHIQNESISLMTKDPSDHEEEEEDDNSPKRQLMSRSGPTMGDCFLLPEEQLFGGGEDGDVIPSEEEDPALQWQKERRQMGFEAQSHIELFDDDNDSDAKGKGSLDETDAVDFSPEAARRNFMRRDDSNHQAQIFTLDGSGDDDPFATSMFPESPKF